MHQLDTTIHCVFGVHGFMQCIKNYRIMKEYAQDILINFASTFLKM